MYKGKDNACDKHPNWGVEGTKGREPGRTLRNMEEVGPDVTFELDGQVGRGGPGTPSRGNRKSQEPHMCGTLVWE